ncbi:MAG: hypothetical protein AAFY88_15640 [Acidobacteriota bacterium]
MTRRVPILPFLALAATLLLLSGCFDHRQRIATQTLYTPDGILIEEAYAAALTARFPPGTALSEFLGHMETVDGRCWDRVAGQSRRCEVPIRGWFCGVALAGINVQLQAGGTRIDYLEVTVGGLSC